MGWLTGWRPGVLVSVQLRKSAGNPLKCLLMDNTGGGGSLRRAKLGKIASGEDPTTASRNSTAKPCRMGPDEGGRKGRHLAQRWGGWWSTSSGHVHLLTHVLSVHSPPYNPKGTDAKVDHTCWGELRRPISFLHLLPLKVRSHSKCCAVLKSCGTLCCPPTDCSLPGFLSMVVLQATIL